MSEDVTPLITELLSVDIANGKIVLDGELPVVAVLTADAAIETGVQLIKAGVKVAR